MREILGYLRDFLFLAQDTRENKNSLTRLETEVTELTRTVEKLAYEMNTLREFERLEREKLTLQLQLAFSQIENRLLPSRQ